jgi:iron complex transport system permease protein
MILVNLSRRSGYINQKWLILVLLGVALILAFLVDLVTGPVKIPALQVWKIIFSSGAENPTWKTILYDFRIPKALTAVIAGSSLAVSGLQMQTIFRNPLAGPDVLGISSGASLGVAFVVLGFSDLFTSGHVNYMGHWVQIISAWTGAAAVLFLVLAVSLRVRDIMTILILGILFGSASSAIVNILQYFSHQSMLKVFVIWTMGSLGNLTGSQLQVLLLGVCAGFLLSLISLKLLNALMLGETYARSLGINIRLTRILVFASTSILAGSVTAFCGPIAFIGIAIPHLARMIFKTAEHKILIPSCVLLGGLLMLLADLLTQIPGSETILPINSVTALLGIPIVIWVIIRNRKLVSIS